jgi:hypothetical protein
VPDDTPAVESLEVKPGRKWSAREQCDQVDQVRDWITSGYPPHRIRRLCAEHWGLACRTAESRMQQARREMVRDVGDVDRKEVAAMLAETAVWILQEARDSKQLSNALGAARLHAEILGIMERKGSN